MATRSCMSRVRHATTPPLPVAPSLLAARAAVFTSSSWAWRRAVRIREAPARANAIAYETGGVQGSVLPRDCVEREYRVAPTSPGWTCSVATMPCGVTPCGKPGPESGCDDRAGLRSLLRFRPKRQSVGRGRAGREVSVSEEDRSRPQSSGGGEEPGAGVQCSAVRTTRTVLPARRAAPAENTPLAIVASSKRGVQRIVRRESAPPVQRGTAEKHARRRRRRPSSRRAAAAHPHRERRAATGDRRQATGDMLARTATPSAARSLGRRAWSASATARTRARPPPASDSTTHFGFRDVPEPEKESLGQSSNTLYPAPAPALAN